MRAIPVATHPMVVRAAKSRAGMRVFGPNCPGIVNTADAIRMNATVVGARAGWG
jgi:hypothetical protein